MTKNYLNKILEERYFFQKIFYRKIKDPIINHVAKRVDFSNVDRSPAPTYGILIPIQDAIKSVSDPIIRHIRNNLHE